MTKRSSFRFTKRLLNDIASFRNAKVKPILNEKLARAYYDHTTLLHHAIQNFNSEIAQELIRLGADVNLQNIDGKTPLMTAVTFDSSTCVEILLKANCRLDVVDNDGKTALKLAHDQPDPNMRIIKDIQERLRSETPSTEELIDKLIAAGSSLYYIGLLKDVKCLQCAVARGFDVNSRGPKRLTALHAATQSKDLASVKWLISVGADVNALDNSNRGPLYFAAESAKTEMTRLFLERGANPNVRDLAEGCTPLAIAVEYYFTGHKKEKRVTEYAECVELLLERGAVPMNAYRSTIFDFAFEGRNPRVIEALIGRMTMLERLGFCDAKSLMRFSNRGYSKALKKIERNYKLCQRKLRVEVFEGLTLFDLLVESEGKVKRLVRKKTFVSKVEKFCERKLIKGCSYYSRIMMKRVEKARRGLKLEDDAIQMIGKLFGSSYNRCYYFAREVVGYLDERDLERLVQVLYD